MKLNDTIDNLMKMSQEMICVLSVEGDFIKPGRTFCEYTGYAAEDLVGESISEYIHNDEHEKFFHFFKNLNNGISTFLELDLRFIHSNGKELWMSWSFTIIEKNQVFTIGRINLKLKEENKFLLKKLSESVEYSNSLLYNLPQMVWTADNKGIIDFYNQACLDYTGMSYETANSWTWYSLLHSDDKERVLNCWENSVKRGDSYEVDYRIKRFSCGEYRWLKAKATAHKDERGNIIKWYGSYVDIHDFIELKKDVKKAKVQLKKLLSYTSLYVWSTDKKGIINFSQGCIPESLNIKPGKAKGMSAYSLFKEYPEMQANIRNSLDGMEGLHQCKISSELYDICYKPFINEYNENIGMVGYMQPKAVQEVNLSFDTEDDLNNHILEVFQSELKPPLLTIISFAEILEKRIDDVENRKYLKYIISSGESMNKFLLSVNSDSNFRLEAS